MARGIHVETETSAEYIAREKTRATSMRERAEASLLAERKRRAGVISDIEGGLELDQLGRVIAKRKPICIPLWYRLGLFVARLWRRKRGPVVTEAFGTMDAQHREQMVQFARATGDESLLRGLKLVSVKR